MGVGCWRDRDVLYGIFVFEEYLVIRVCMSVCGGNKLVLIIG